MKSFKRYTKIFFLIVLGIYLISCAIPPMPHEVRYERVVNADNQLANEKRETAEEKIQLADKLLSIISEYDDLLNERAMTNYAKTNIRNYKRQDTELVALLLFSAGQQYRNNGQIDKAKKVYQDIIRIFVGSAWAGYRDRAKMEIDNLK